jgi:hypothetical protein
LFTLNQLDQASFAANPSSSETESVTPYRE